MNLCAGTPNSSHDEICYDSKNCPACYLVYERDEAVSKVEELQDRIKELEAEAEV